MRHLVTLAMLAALIEPTPPPIPGLLPTGIAPTTGFRAVVVSWNHQLDLQQSGLTQAQQAEIIELAPGIDFQMLVNSAGNNPSVVQCGTSAYLTDNYVIGVTPTPVRVLDWPGNDWGSLVMASSPAVFLVGENDTYEITWTGAQQQVSLTDFSNDPAHQIRFSFAVATVP